MFMSQVRTEEKPKKREELQEDLEDLEFQMFRMQDNLKEIAKRWDVIGIEQSKEDRWVIVYADETQDMCKIMLTDCDSSFRGQWDFSIHATYEEDNSIHIGDIKGPANKGYGSICMDYLKEVALKHNVPCIKGDLAERDWDHLHRLIHFYEKHDFEVEVDTEEKCGEIKWYPTM